MAGTVLYCRSTVTGCSGCQCDRVMYLPPLTVASGRATREVFTLVWGTLSSGCTTYIAKRVDYGVIQNCRSCIYIIGCDLFKCYNVDLCMY